MGKPNLFDLFLAKHIARIAVTTIITALLLSGDGIDISKEVWVSLVTGITFGSFMTDYMINDDL